MKQLIIHPRVTDKSYAQAGSNNTYVFNVPKSANKIEIEQTVEKLYGVKVTAVNIVNTFGKSKRTVRKGGRQNIGKRSDYKKAYVSVTKGQTIPVFAAEDTKETK